ncbi:MAG: hypothetical protein GX621_02375 [Pirellulaceae bacterium]|nr:hypothetical protein [Pirellulaceae bacterium]
MIVLGAYCAYAMTVVPLIEPSEDVRRREDTGSQDTRAAQNAVNRQAADLARLFPPGTLQIEDPIILQNDRVKLLIGGYEPDRDGNMVMTPCAIVFLPEGDDPMSSERFDRAVVLEAPQGAVLEFDEPFELGRTSMGQPVGGRLLGPITIRGAGRPGTLDDDLLIVTSNVQLDLRRNNRRIWTRDAVQFRYGPHFGSGSDLQILLLPGDDADIKQESGQGPKIAGLELFELNRLDRLHLRLPDRGSPVGSTSVGGSASAADRATDRPDAPVEVTCTGPFRFDAVRQLATFQDNVLVTRFHPDGQQDRLENCDMLTIHFVPRDRQVSPSGENHRPNTGDNPARPLDLEPARIEAVGDPVAIRAPSMSVAGRGERLEYDLIKGRLLLEGSHPVLLSRGNSFIEAALLQYESPEPGWRLGRIVAVGPGRIRAEIDDKPDQVFEAKWNQELRVQPQDYNQVISLTGGTELLYGGMGRISAGEIHFYLNEIASPDDPRRFDLRPDRMCAENNVDLQSPRISGRIDELQVWFRHDPAAAGGVVSAAGMSGAAGIAGPAMPPAGEPLANANPLPERHFHATGRLLQARILLGDRAADLDELILSDHVELIETRTTSPDDKPIIVRGECIHVKNASQPHAAVGVKGRPARFEGRGLVLAGTNLNLNRGTNLLWIDGTGWMDLPPLKRDLQGRPSASNEPMRVYWDDGMKFDGRTAAFNGKVRAVSSLVQLRTDTLEASLDRTVDFSQADQLQDSATPFNLHEIRCTGAVWMENRIVENDVQKSFEHVETQNLLVNNATGELRVVGPGRLRTVRTGKMNLDQFAAPGRPARRDGREAAAAVEPSDGDSLHYLQVRFQGGIRGDIHKREITFHDRVTAVFGPVDAWDATLPEDNPDALGLKGARLSTEALTVREMPSPIGNEPTTEFETSGGTRVDNRLYTALCDQMSYNQAKGLMIFKGDGRTKATLSRQEQIGGPRESFSGQQINFWPETKETTVSGAGQLQINLPPEKKPPKP